VFEERPLPYIGKYLEKNKSLLELVAVFIAIASFIIDLNKDNDNISLTTGAIFIILFVGLLLGYLLYITMKENILPLLSGKSDNLHETIQLFFISFFIICLIIAYSAILSYFALPHPILAGWILIFLFTCILGTFGLWFVTALYTYFTENNRAIKLIQSAFILLALASLIFISTIYNFINEFFLSPGQSMWIYCVIFAYFIFGFFHFTWRIPGT
jgi:hypothetical protein